MSPYLTFFNSEYNSDYLNSFLSLILDFGVKFLLMLLYILVCWLFIRVISFLCKKALRLVRLDKVNQFFENNDWATKAQIQIDPVWIVVTFVKWFCILIFIVIGSDLFGLTVFSAEIGNFVSYIPKLFTAVVIFVAGVYLAMWVRKSIQNFLKVIDFTGGKLMASVVFYVLLVFIGITALNQAGVNTDIITQNIAILIGAICLMFALSLGLGSKEVVHKLLLSFYTRKNVHAGQRIRVKGYEGLVLSVDHLYVVMLVDDNKVVLPIKEVANSEIEILS